MTLNLDQKIFPLHSSRKLEALLGCEREYFKHIASKSGRYYKPFDTRKIGKEKWRHIDNPVDPLKALQKKINKRILRSVMLILPKQMIGGIPGKSIVHCAKFHTKQEMVVTLDLRDCFPSINNQKVYSIWSQTLNVGRRNSALLTQLTTFQTRLPQGAATSLALCNLALLPLFEEIKVYCEPRSISFTFYVDDITLSGKHNEVLISMKPIISMIQKYGYAIRSKKIRKMPASQKQIVNSVLVNSKVSKEMDEIELIRTTIINIAQRKESSISQKEMESILGKIQHIKQLSEEKGIRLEEFAHTLLDGFELVEIKVNKKYEIRQCDNPKRHKYYL